jgi:hypothetical protein
MLPSNIEYCEHCLCLDHDSRFTVVSPICSTYWQTPSPHSLLLLHIPQPRWMTHPKILPAYGTPSRGSPASSVARPQPQPLLSNDQRAQLSTPSAVSQTKMPCLQDQHSEAAGRQEFQIVASASTTRCRVLIMDQVSQTWWLVVRNRENLEVVCFCLRSLLTIAMRTISPVMPDPTRNSRSRVWGICSL